MSQWNGAIDLLKSYIDEEDNEEEVEKADGNPRNVSAFQRFVGGMQGAAVRSPDPAPSMAPPTPPRAASSSPVSGSRAQMSAASPFSRLR